MNKRKQKKMAKLALKNSKRLVANGVVGQDGGFESEETQLFADAVMHDLRLENSMREALGLPENGSQVSEDDTIYKNLRGYLVSNNRYLLSQLYCEIGIAQTLIDVPVDDAYRGGVEIHSKQLSEEEISEIVATMSDHGDLQVLAQTDKWCRLFGGAGTIVLTDQDPSTPLDINSLEKGAMLEFKDADLWELFFAAANIENQGMMPDWNVEFFDYYGIQVHRSRVLLAKGKRAPSFVRPRLRGWGLSVLESLVRSINQYLKTVDLTFEVLDEFKVDVYKIKNFAASLLSPNGATLVRQRIQTANMEKDFNNAITMDTEDDYQQKQISFTGLAEVMKENRMQIAADTRMPMSKIFGIASSGFSSGEDDIENYNSMIESSIRELAKKNVLTLVKLRCQQLHGMVPEDISVNFLPLRMLSAEQEENVKTQKFNRLSASAQSGLISGEEFRDGVNRDKLLPVQLDPTLDLNQLDLGADDDETDQEDIAPAAPKTKLKPQKNKEAKS